MAGDKQDIRVRKTKKALALTLLSLLEKQSFSKITVNDICQDAMISRSAFYVHFEDKYDLLRFCMDELKLRLFQESEGMPIEDRIQNVLNQIRQNIRIFRNLTLSQMDAELMEMLHRSFLIDMERILEHHKSNGATLPGPTDIVSAYYTHGITGAILHWIKNNMQYSTGEMAQYLCALLPTLPVGSRPPNPPERE